MTVRDIDHSEMVSTLQNGYRTKIPQFYMGRTAIGKSNTIHTFCADKAAELSKELVDWNNTSLEKKKAIVEDPNPEKYFGFIDIRLSQYDPTDLRGLPSVDGVYTVWKNNLWVEAFKRIEGVILFDEINHAPPIMQNAVYQILLERQVGETPLSDGVLVIGAGNVAEDKSATFRLPKPIISRVFIYRLKVPSVKSWTSWALAKNVDPRVISYLQWKQSCLFLEDDKDMNITTPRGWEFVSRSIDGVDDFEQIELYSSGILGPGGAIEFVSFLKLTKKFDLDHILKAPTTAELPTEMSQRYALVAALTGRYKDDKPCFNGLIKVSARLPPEFGMLMVRMMKSADVDSFKTNIFKTKEGEAIMEKLGSYM